MTEMPTATVELQLAPELTALVDRLASLVGHLEGCAIRVLNLQPGDVIVLESSQRLSERAYEWLTKQAKEQWPNNRFIILDSCKFAGVTREGHSLQEERMRCIAAIEKKAYGSPDCRAGVQRAITTILEMED